MPSLSGGSGGVGFFGGGEEPPISVALLIRVFLPIVLVACKSQDTFSSLLSFSGLVIKSLQPISSRVEFKESPKILNVGQNFILVVVLVAKVSENGFFSSNSNQMKCNEIDGLDLESFFMYVPVLG